MFLYCLRFNKYDLFVLNDILILLLVLLRERGFKMNSEILEIESSDYPNKIKNTFIKKPFDEIYYQGNLDLLKKNAIAFSGSRDCSENSLKIAVECTLEAIKKDYAIIGGNARGIDRACHLSALKNGGSTIFVIPQGIKRLGKLHSSLLPFLTLENFLILSVFDPLLSWNVNSAMIRNEVIVALSEALIIIEANSSGGAFSAGWHAIKMKKLLFVINNYCSGNQKLIQLGGIPLGKNSSTNKPAMKKVFNAINILAL